MFFNRYNRSHNTRQLRALLHTAKEIKHLAHRCPIGLDFHVLTQQTEPCWALHPVPPQPVAASAEVGHIGSQRDEDEDDDMVLPPRGRSWVMVQKASYKHFQRVGRAEGTHQAWTSFLWIQRPEVGLAPGTFLGFKGMGAIWKREHYPSPCRMASLISIFISIRGVL